MKQMCDQPLDCKWQGCNSLHSDPETLYQHLTNEHVGRKSSGNLCLNCHWADCQVQTTKRDHITSHLRVHVPLKPFSCKICGKSFKRHHDMKKHERIHADQETPNSGPASPGNNHSRRSSIHVPVYDGVHQPPPCMDEATQHSKPAASPDGGDVIDKATLQEPLYWSGCKAEDKKQQFLSPTDVLLSPESPQELLFQPQKRDLDALEQSTDSDVINQFILDMRSKKLKPDYDVEDTQQRLDNLAAFLEQTNQLAREMPSQSCWNSDNLFDFRKLPSLIRCSSNWPRALDLNTSR
jgi:uncharacterized Zn-finger protein